jgi:hypothetical protein
LVWHGWPIFGEYGRAVVLGDLRHAAVTPRCSHFAIAGIDFDRLFTAAFNVGEQLEGDEDRLIRLFAIKMELGSGTAATASDAEAMRARRKLDGWQVAAGSQAECLTKDSF